MDFNSWEPYHQMLFGEFKCFSTWLIGQRVIQVACGSRDAQTLALTEDGIVYSWGDGDFGKLGENLWRAQCDIPPQIINLVEVVGSLWALNWGVWLDSRSGNKTLCLSQYSRQFRTAVLNKRGPPIELPSL